MLVMGRCGSFVDTKMGYKTGTGLGKHEQGILTPINVNAQLGTCGLGISSQQDFHNVSEDIISEMIRINESVKWLENREFSNDGDLNFKTMTSWLVHGPQITKIDNESHFCDPEILRDVLDAKCVLSGLNEIQLCKARARANPFETIGSVFFMNRAALKMASIDAATDFMFTSIDRDPLHRKENGPYYFADVCAGPGGFTEYILWRKRWLFKGFGLTLRDTNDFKLGNSGCASGTTFLPLYGARGDGNVYCPDNIKDFKEKVLHETQHKGVHFMMSDGGFSVEGNEDLQEILSKQIYICQCLVALEIVRKNGHFVTKLFDLYTVFSVGLIYLMRKCFRKVCIFKPNSSRPANSERYLICYGKKTSTEMLEIQKYLHKIVDELWKIKCTEVHSGNDVLEIVPLEVIQSDKELFTYIKESNNCIGQKQIKALEKLYVFYRNPLLAEPRQEDIRHKSLKYWMIPDRPKTAPVKQTLDDVLDSSMQDSDFLYAQPKEIHNLNDLNDKMQVTDWHYCFLSSSASYNSCGIYAAVGNSKIYKLENNKWTSTKNIHLVPGTILFGEMVQENLKLTEKLGEESYIKKTSLHVIDAVRLGDISLADLCFDERLNLIKTYCEAVNHEASSKHNIRIRAKEVYPLSTFDEHAAHLSGNNNCALPVLGFNSSEENYNIASILLLKSDDLQSFNSTYLLRTQVCLDENFNCDKDNTMTVNLFQHFVKSLNTNSIS